MSPEWMLLIACIMIVVLVTKLQKKDRDKAKTIVVSDEEDWSKVVERVVHHENMILGYNKKLIESITHISPTAMRDFLTMTHGMTVVGKIEQVKYPDGRYQPERTNATFHKVHVQYLKDDKVNKIFYGYIFALYGNSNFWLKIPFES